MTIHECIECKDLTENESNLCEPCLNRHVSKCKRNEGGGNKMRMPDIKPDVTVAGGGCQANVFGRMVWYLFNGKPTMSRPFATRDEAEKNAHQFIADAVSEMEN